MHERQPSCASLPHRRFCNSTPNMQSCSSGFDCTGVLSTRAYFSLAAGSWTQHFVVHLLFLPDRLRVHHCPPRRQKRSIDTEFCKKHNTRRDWNLSLTCLSSRLTVSTPAQSRQAPGSSFELPDPPRSACPQTLVDLHTAVAMFRRVRRIE
jgi:hypothetical protein